MLAEQKSNPRAYNVSAENKSQQPGPSVWSKSQSRGTGRTRAGRARCSKPQSIEGHKCEGAKAIKGLGAGKVGTRNNCNKGPINPVK